MAWTNGFFARLAQAKTYPKLADILRPPGNTDAQLVAQAKQLERVLEREKEPPKGRRRKRPRTILRPE